MSSYNHFGCSWGGGTFNGGNCSGCSSVGSRNEFVYDPNPYSYNETPDFFNQPPHHQYETYLCELCGDSPHYGFDCQTRPPLVYEQDSCSNQNFSNDQSPYYSMSLPQQFDCCEVCGGPHYSSNYQAGNTPIYDQGPHFSSNCQIRNPLVYEPNPSNNYEFLCFDQPPQYSIDHQPQIIQEDQAANISTHTPEPSRRFNSFYDDDDYEESIIPLNEIVSQIPPSIAITPILPTLEPEDSLIMGNEELSTFPEKESDEGKYVTFSNPLFDSNDDFTSSDEESLSDEDVQDDNVKIYSNPHFEFDDEYISSDVNSLFAEVFENIKSKDSYVSNLDEPALLVTPLSAFNENECFDPGGDVDEIELLLHHDPSTPKVSVASILEGFTHEPPLVENDDLFDLESKENEWKKILYDAPIDDLMTEDKIFDPGIPEKFFSPTYVKLPFEDRHDLSFTYVIWIFLSYFTYPVESPFLLSSGSEDTIFDPGIFTFHFSSLKPVASHRSETFMSGFVSGQKLPPLVPSSPCPPEKPPDDDVYFDIEPNTGVLTTKVVDDIYDNSTRELYVHVPNVLPTIPTLYPVFDTLLPSHQGFKVFQHINDSESPMMIYGEDISILDVPFLHFYPP
ncbi:hypothetical protein Tco_1186984 [Tanacetum coccineum]